jgi:hypothetical protein
MGMLVRSHAPAAYIYADIYCGPRWSVRSSEGKHIRYDKGDKDLDSGDQSKRNVELGDRHAKISQSC